VGRANSRVETRLREFLRKRGLGSGSLAVAYSGGPDSGALLAALSALGGAAPLAFYVDHGLRPRSELGREFELVKSVCGATGARLLVARVAPGKIAGRAGDEGIEASARRYRYAALRSMLLRSGARAVLLGHTRDDQAETFLMRLLGGSGAEGLRGMNEASGAFLRPFLGLPKSELIAYLGGRGLPYSVDSTNVSSEYLRNRVRRDLVPLLDLSFPGWRSGMARAAAKAARDGAALGELASRIAFAPRPGGGLAADAAALAAAPEAVARRAIVEAAGRLLGRSRFPDAAAGAALEIVRAGPGSSYAGAGIALSRRGDEAVLTPAERGKASGLDFPSRDGYFVVIDRPCRVRLGKLVVEASWRSGSLPGINADAFRFPLVVRTRRPGDSIAGAKGSKRLDELFSEWGIPGAARRRIPVVEDRDGVVAVLGEGRGGKDRFRRASVGGAPPGLGPVERGSGRFSIFVKGA
jgi:tRNA(Ile)-lysidine synthase